MILVVYTAHGTYQAGLRVASCSPVAAVPFPKDQLLAGLCTANVSVFCCATMVKIDSLVLITSAYYAELWFGVSTK